MKLESRVQVLDSPTRCPYCHEHVDVEVEAWVVCRACLARHHSSCWEPTAGCATCSSSAFLAPETHGRAHTRRDERPAASKQAGTGRLEVGAALRAGAAFYRRPGFGLIFLASAITSLLTGASLLVLGGMLEAGLWTVFLRSAKRRETSLKDLFAHSGRFGALTGAYLVAFMIFVASFLFGGLPYFFAAAFFSYVIPLMSERGLSFGEAFSESASSAKAGGLGAHLALALCTFALSIPAMLAGMIAPGVGDAIVSALLAPLTFGAWVSAYRQVVEGEPVDPKRLD